MASDEEAETSLIEIESRVVHGIERGPRERKNASSSGSSSTESLLSGCDRTSPPAAVLHESL